jgi:hypothetical protein
MKIRYHKPVSLYTHPAITDYEFNRMKKVEKLYTTLCVVCFLAMMLSFPFILMSGAKEVKPVTPIETNHEQAHLSGPLQTVSGEWTEDDTAVLEINVGSTTVDTR